MNKFAKIGDGLGGWLTFEQGCGRYPLFCESYLAYPIGQLLQYRYPGRVLSEVKHPLLSDRKEGPGKKPRIDFVVTGENRKFDLAVETKWVSKSATLTRDIIRDIVRLDLLLPNFTNEALLILAGNVRNLKGFLNDPIFQPHRGKPILVRENYSRSAVYFFHALSELRRDFYLKVLEAFGGVEISTAIQLERSGPFPRQTKMEQYQVYVWRILPRGKKFKPEEYQTRSLEHLKKNTPQQRLATDYLQPTR